MNKPQIGRKYSQNVNLTEELYSDYIQVLLINNKKQNIQLQ